jgi:glycosyltransferase involved in cell wall biosynthesis
LIFQGAGINRDRGGEELIDAIAITDNVSLLVIGSGDKYEVLIENASKQGLTDRIRFLPKLPWNDLMRYTKAVDAGLSLDKNSNLNYKYSLPNKLFDYISAGIPVLATELPEITKIVTEYKFGILISEPSPGEISKALKVLRDDRQLLSELKRNSALASESINWENESLKVAELYRSILNQI